MANEITISLSMSASKGGASINTVGATGPASATYNMTGADMLSATQALTTSTIAVPLGSVTGDYRLYACNLEDPLATTPATISFDRATPVSANPPIRLAAGDECLIVVPSGTTMYVNASANCSMYYAVVEK